MPFEDDDLIFNGSNSTEAERFITWVRRKARSEGKTRDEDWILELVSASLGGSALRWFFKLDSSIQNSWALLQPAILDNWADSETSHSPVASSVIPTPAAAPGQATAPALPPRSFSAPQTGRIRVLGDSATTYLSRILNETYGIFLTTTDKAEALHVTFTPSEKPHPIELVNCTGPYQWLGLRQAAADNLTIKHHDYLSITTTTAPWSNPIVSSDKNCTGRSQCSVWNVSPFPDRTIRMSWDIGRTDYACVLTEVAFRKDKGWPCIVADYDAYVNAFGREEYCQSRLVFDPFS